MTRNDNPTDPNAETVGLPSDDSGKGSVPEPGKFATSGMPSEIGRYRILGIIASGGMGVVYEAMQEAPRRRVALKVIKAGAASDMALHRFHFEAQTLAKLSHPNIAQIYEAGTWESGSGEVPFFAMEYIPGARSVVSYAQSKDLAIKDRLTLFAKICEAVHHGHQKGVIHRDLKPDNILVDSSGEPKIIDFGVARATDADLAVTTMQTTMGQLIGTLQYMSPEQCDADPDRIDTRSDVYALGVILFQLLSGKLPYDLRRQAIHEAVRIIKDERPTSMGTIDINLRGDVDTIALKALEKDRDRRYQSAAELAGDINHYLNNEPIIARPLSIGYQVRLFTKKYKRTCAAVLLLVVSVVLGLFGTAWGMLEAKQQEKIAIEQGAVAEQRYATILNMSRDFIGGFYKGIVKLNAALDVREHVLDSTLMYLGDLELTAGETNEILAEKARTNKHLGDLFAGTSAANIGDIFKSHSYHTEALSMYLQLVKSGEKKFNQNVASEYVSLANLAILEGDYSDATELLQNSRDVLDIFMLDYPNDLGGQRLGDRIQMRTLDIYMALDQDEEIRKLIEELKETRHQRMMADPSNLKLKRGYASILLRFGRVYLALEDFQTSSQTYRDSISIFEELVDAEPENGRAVRDLAWGNYFLGEGYLVASNIPDGFDGLELGLSLIRDRCVAYPNADDARNDVSTYLENYIKFCDKYNQHQRGKKATYAVVLALQPVVEHNPANHALGEVYAKAEKIHKKISQLAAAEQPF